MCTITTLFSGQSKKNRYDFSHIDGAVPTVGIAVMGSVLLGSPQLCMERNQN